MAKKVVLFELCLAVIVFVTAVDIFWSIYLSKDLLTNEQNPIAKWIISLGDRLDLNGVAVLCSLKVVGTFLVLFICRTIYERKYKWAIPVAGGVAAFQLWLFGYLHFGHLF